jgi:hypothetical protein
LSGYGYSNNTSFYTGEAWPEFRYIQSKYPYTVQPDDTLRCVISYAISEGWDYGYVEISTDGENFTPMEGNITTNLMDGYGHNRGNGITGWSEDQWVPAFFDLSDYVGESVYFRFSYYMYDLAFDWGGFVVDDIWPVASFESSEILGGSITDTTFAVPGRTSGIYSYYVRAMDENGQWSDRSLLESVVVGQQYVCGDPSGDGSVNLIDILYIIDFLYNDPPGPAPDPEASGDVNGGDGNVNLIDILYLIDFLYGDPAGPEPDCG